MELKKRIPQDVISAVPVKDDIWVHTKSGGRYQVLGTTYNAVTDRIDVKYAPCYDCEFPEFTRQMMGHPKAWLSKNDDGTPRFVREPKQ